MKTIFKLSIIAALPAVAFLACSQNPDILEELRPSIGETVNLTISTDRSATMDTRTMVAEDGVTPMWCPEDAIGVSVFNGGSYTNHEFTNDNTESPTHITTFSGKTAVSDLLYSYYPYTPNGVNAEGEVLMTIPDVQNPTPASFDGAADILVGKPVEMKKETTKIEGLQFKRVGGFLKIILKDATSGNIITGETVESLSITAQSTLAGNAYLDIVNGELGKIHANRSTKVTAKYGSDTEYKIGNEDSAAYLGVYPQTLAEGSTIIISAKTTFYDIEREIELPEDIEIKAGQITTLNININAEDISERKFVIEELFPDPILRQYVSDYIDINKDEKLSKNEILAVTGIYVSNSWEERDNENKTIKSLEGIQYFTNLNSLYCDYNQLTTLDVSKNTALTYLYCYDNQLTTLDVSNNTALTALSCGMNQLTTLDVSNNTALISLRCDDNQLTTLNVSKNTALIELRCYCNQLTVLDMSKNTALTVLSCDINQLTTLDVSNNTALEYLSCGNNQLTTLDVSKNTALQKLDCGMNQLTSLDVSNNTALQELSCYDNQLTALEMSNNTALTMLGCENNQLTTLDVSKNTALQELYCDDNQLMTFEMSNNTALIVLFCENNQLTALDVSNNTELKALCCGGNQLTSLDVSKNTALEELWCQGNQLTTLDVSKTNLGNSKYIYPLDCAPMSTLQTLTLKRGWSINRITYNRSTNYIPSQTQIVYVD